MALRVGERMSVAELLAYGPEAVAGVQFVEAGVYRSGLVVGQFVVSSWVRGEFPVFAPGTDRRGWQTSDINYYVDRLNLQSTLDLRITLVVVPTPMDSPPVPFNPAKGMTVKWADSMYQSLQGWTVCDPDYGNVDQWVVQGQQLVVGPDMAWREAPYTPVPGRLMLLRNDVPYAPLERLVVGAKVPFRDLVALVEETPGCLDGLEFDNTGHSHLEGQGYWKFAGNWITSGSRRGTNLNVGRDGWIVYLVVVPPGCGNRMGPRHLRPPGDGVIACPLCRNPGVGHHQACDGLMVGKAFGAFAMCEQCPKCHQTVWRGTVTETMCERCHERRNTIRREGGQPDWFRFGIEIETESLPYDQPETVAGAARKAMKDALPGAKRGWNGRPLRPDKDKGWEAKADGSLRGPVDKRGNHKNAEITSPPLPFGPESLLDVREMARKLRNAGARNMSERCGVHVHVDVADLTYRQLASLGEWWWVAQGVIHAAIPPERTRASFCAPWPDNYLAHIRSCANRSRREDMGANPAARRYENLNYLAMQAHGTVEFRLFNGTVHAGKLAAYITLAVHTVARATREVKGEGDRLPMYPATREGMVKLLDDLQIVDKSARWHLLGTFQRDEDRPFYSVTA
jgi:hypothetical protein